MSFVLPSGIEIDSSVSTSTGSRSSTCSATPIQISVAIVRSKVSIHCAWRKVWRSTSTTVRMIASEPISAIATDSRLTGTNRCSAARATSMPSSASSGQATRRAHATANSPLPRASRRRSIAFEAANDRPRHSATASAAHQPCTVASSSASRFTSGPSSRKSNSKPFIRQA